MSAAKESEQLADSAGNGADAWLVGVGKSIAQEFSATRRVLSFPAYLELVAAQPLQQLRGAAQYLLDCVDHYGRYEVGSSRGPVMRYRLFDAPWDPSGGDVLVGQEWVAEQLYRYLKSCAREGGVRRVLLLHGPNGSAKSTLIRTLGRGLEHFSHQAEGALYRLSWVFPKPRMGRGGIGFGGQAEAESLESFAHLSDEQVDARLVDELRDHPLLVLPAAQRKAFMADALARHGAGDHILPDVLERGELSAKNRAVFDALLANYHGDFLKVIRHIRVERFYIDQRQRVGYVTVEPQLSVDATERQVTADRSVAALPASLQTVALFEYGGELVGANRGVIEYDDLLKRPMESYKYLLTTVERNTVSLASATLGLDVVYLASSNEQHVAAFKEYQDFQSFKGRFEFVRVPYLLSIAHEQSLYERRLKEAIGTRHVAPHVAYVLALFAVLTRMRKPQVERYPESVRELVANLTPLAKAELYTEGRVPPGLSGEAAKRLRALARELTEESDGYPNYEGKLGASPRELLGILMTAASSTKHSYVSPLVILDELAELVSQVSLYEYLRLEPMPGGYHDYDAMLEAVRDKLAERIEGDVRIALGLVDAAEHQRVFERYMQHVTHWVRGEKLKNPATGKHEDPDEALMQEVERALRAKAENESERRQHRDGLVTKVGVWSVEHPGQRPVLDVIFAEELQRLSDSYYEQATLSVRAGIDGLLSYLLAPDGGRLSEAERREQEAVVARLVAAGYEPQSARDLLGFLKSRRYR